MSSRSVRDSTAAYLVATGESQHQLAQRAGLRQSHVHRAVHGADIRSSHALELVRASQRRPGPRGQRITLEGIVRASLAR